MTTWHPDTCYCIVDLEAKQLIEKCKTHKNANQTLAHNRSFNKRHGVTPTDQQREQIAIDKILEKKKPEFARS